MSGPEIDFDWDEVNIGLLVVTTWREDRVRVVTAFEAIKRLIQVYYQERER